MACGFSEPASIWPLCIAIASSLTETPVPDIAMIGEVGLGGEVRSVSHIRQRVSEARKLGFERCLVPMRNAKELQTERVRDIIGVATLQEALEATGCRPS